MKTTAGQRLKQFRQTAQLETGDIAELLMCSKSLVEKMESGGMPVSEKTAKSLFQKCRVPMEWLIDGKGDLSFEFDPKNPYRDYVVKRLEDEVEFLRNILRGFSTKGNFHTALNSSGSHLSVYKG